MFAVLNEGGVEGTLFVEKVLKITFLVFSPSHERKKEKKKEREGNGKGRGRRGRGKRGTKQDSCFFLMFFMQDFKFEQLDLSSNVWTCWTGYKEGLTLPWVGKHSSGVPEHGKRSREIPVIPSLSCVPRGGCS